MPARDKVALGGLSAPWQCLESSSCEGSQDGSWGAGKGPFTQGLCTALPQLPLAWISASCRAKDLSSWRRHSPSGFPHPEESESQLVQKHLRVMGTAPAKLHFCPFLPRAKAKLLTQQSLLPGGQLCGRCSPCSQGWWRHKGSPGLSWHGQAGSEDLPARSPCRRSA